MPHCLVQSFVSFSNVSSLIFAKTSAHSGRKCSNSGSFFICAIALRCIDPSRRRSIKPWNMLRCRRNISLSGTATNGLNLEAYASIAEVIVGIAVSLGVSNSIGLPRFALNFLKKEYHVLKILSIARLKNTALKLIFKNHRMGGFFTISHCLLGRRRFVVGDDKDGYSAGCCFH